MATRRRGGKRPIGTPGTNLIPSASMMRDALTERGVDYTGTDGYGDTEPNLDEQSRRERAETVRRARDDVSRREPMTDAQLIGVIEERESKAADAKPTAQFYSEAFNTYVGGPLGNELPDRSRIVMMEMFSVIEWIKPVLAKIFFGGPSVVKFRPTKTTSVDAAEQESEYINHLVTQRNDGFTTVMNWFTDAMINRNAYAIAYWEETVDTTESEYKHQPLEIAQLIFNDPDVEVYDVQQTEVMSVEGPQVLYSLKCRERQKQGKLCIDLIQPERVLIDANHKKLSLADCRFVEYVEEKTISELRELGFDVPDDVTDDYGEDINADEVKIARESQIDGHTYDDDDDPDPSSRLVKVRTIFMRVDRDGDGIAELRRVIVVGRTILYDQPDDIIAIACLSPILMPHRHVGMGFYDVVKQLQDLKTQMARGLVDNMHLANNGRWFISEDVDQADFFNSRPNAPVRVEGDTVVGKAMPFQHPVLGPQIINTLEYADSVMENWTGASPRSLQGQTFDGNSINKTASGLSQIMSAALARIELIARFFAETGLRDLFLIAHALTLKHRRQQDIFELRGEWVAVDPRQWEKRSEMTVDTGLGTGDKQERISALQQLIAAQSSIGRETRLAGPAQIHYALTKLTETMGYKDSDRYWARPEQAQQGGLESLPEEQRNAVLAQLQQIADQTFERRKMEMTQQAQMRKIDVDAATALMNAEVDERKALLNAMVQAGNSALKADTEMATAGLEPAGLRAAEAEDVQQLIQRAIEQFRAQPRTVRHTRDSSGRIVSSQIVNE